MNLWQSVYNEIGLDPINVTYVEAHCTGTKAGDPQEGNALSTVFCKSKRETPLLIGSVKTNMGHAEPAAGQFHMSRRYLLTLLNCQDFLTLFLTISWSILSLNVRSLNVVVCISLCFQGLASLAKVVIAMENGLIPANLQYATPNPAIPALSEGIMKVVTENTPWPGGYIAINSSGFGGSNVHALLQSNQRKLKEDHPAKDSQRLIVYSGRTEEGLQETLTVARNHGQDVDLHALLEETAQTALGLHPYRGYTLANNANNVMEVKVNYSTPSCFIALFYTHLLFCCMKE